ncbi:MAG: helix-turn-helix transcriptional regulator [Synergistes sp.]|nr:helix-turn-helix transcriptional regulator [Synergistes sp.]
MDYKHLGRKIRKERKKLNLTQGRLAEEIDVSDTYIGAIERGERGLSLETLLRLCKRFGVTVDYLISDCALDNDPGILAQFRQITGNQSIERKQLAINILRSVFAHFDSEAEKEKK